tara:strand:- start:493 stop:1392 length:900 start_codon:yes stop_codon:yes gene_type:complete
MPQLYFYHKKLFNVLILYSLSFTLIFHFSVNLVWSADLIGKPNCEYIANLIENDSNLPKHLLSSISRVEAGRKLSSGEVKGWPWAINHAGKGLYFETKKGALKYLKNAVNNGSKNIDVGCMQLNYRWHKGAFSSLEEMFDPEKNVQYAAEFVKELFDRHKNWEDVIKHYHSNKKKFNIPYYKKVAKVWDEQQKTDIDDNLLGFSQTVKNDNPLGFVQAENIQPVIEKENKTEKEVEPIIIYDASLVEDISDTTHILNKNGLNFERNTNELISNSPVNVPKFIKKHWSLVLSLRQQLEKE